MINWLGQNIEVGSVVGRGARQGNSSDFKLGVVTKLDEPNQKVRVQWRYESSVRWHYEPTGQYYDSGWNKGKPVLKRQNWGLCPVRREGAGSPSIESLFVLADSDLARAEQLCKLSEEYVSRLDNFPMTWREWDDRVEDICATM